MGFRGNNSRTFAEYVELEIAIDEYSPNAYLFKRRDSETNKPVSERSWIDQSTKAMQEIPEE